MKFVALNSCKAGDLVAIQPMKLKKKSYVGYVGNNWYKHIEWNGFIEQCAYIYELRLPNIRKSKLGFIKNGCKKVRVTIEEIE